MTPIKGRLAQAAIPGAALLWAIVEIIRSSGVAIRYPDSATYLIWPSARTPGYPLILAIVRDLTGSVDAIIYVQIAIEAIALALLGLAIKRATKSVCYGFAVVLVGLAIMAYKDYHSVILTESIFASIEMCFLASLILTLDRPKSWAFAALSLATGCAIAVRPPGYSLLPLLLLVLIPVLQHERRRIWRSIAAVTIPATVIMAASSLAYAGHSNDGASLLGRILYAKSVFVNGHGGNAFPPASAEHRAWEDAEARGKELRGLVAGAPNLVARDLLLVNYEVILQNGTSRISPQLDDLSGAEREQVMQTVGAARLRGAPAETLAIGFTHLMSMWGLLELLDPSSAAALETYLAPRRPLPFDAADGMFAERRPDMGAKIYALRLFNLALCFATVAIAAIFAIRAVAGKASPLLWMAGLASLLVHGNLILVAFANIGIQRYFFILWPALLSTLVLAGASALSSRKRYLTRTAPSPGRNS